MTPEQTAIIKSLLAQIEADTDRIVYRSAHSGLADRQKRKELVALARLVCLGEGES